MAGKEHPIAKSRSSKLVSRVWRVGVNTVYVMVISLVLSIIIELIGISTWWRDEGLAKSDAMVQQEIKYLGEYASKNVFVKDADQWVINSVSNMNEAIGKYGGNWLIQSYEQSAVYVLAIINTINIFCLRVFVMLFSMPVYLVFGIIGLTRGLVGRELRKWGGGHESSSMFHLYMDMVPLGFMGSWAVYLTWPFSLNPNYVVLPFAMAFGALLMATVHRYKKYV